MKLAPAKHPARPAPQWGWLALVALVAGCTTTSTLPAFNTSDPHWQILTTQAVWTPGHHKQPIAGDVVLAQHPDGRVLIEMSKASLPIAALRLTSNAWHFEASGRPRAYGGQGSPPARSAWLVFAHHLAGGPPPARWTFSTPSTGLLRVANPSSGEALEIQDPNGHGFRSQP